MVRLALTDKQIEELAQGNDVELVVPDLRHHGHNTTVTIAPDNDRLRDNPRP